MSRELRIAVIHYHLKKGGVTRVIENTATAFAESPYPVKIGVLAGPPALDSQSPLAKEIPGLFYTKPSEPLEEDALTQRITRGAETLLGGPPDVWHIHNPSLGKNNNMAGVIRRLAQTNTPILFQIHDFAEDNRPQNYLTLREAGASMDFLYPQAAHIGYSVINGRDRALLQAAGIHSDRLFFLPNSIPASPGNRPPAQSKNDILHKLGIQASDILLYPVRATRRKNLGEFILWSTLYSKNHHISPFERPIFLNTLGPTNPDFQAVFDRWVAISRQYELPVRFAVGEAYGIDFESLVHSASALLSTSVAEGFGLGYLEPWTFGKSLLGRDLPEITRDFTDLGLQLPGLYSRLSVPIAWCGGTTPVRDHLLVHMRKVYRKFGRNLEQATLLESVDSILKGDEVDFGRLDEPLQFKVIEHLLNHPGDAALLTPHTLGNPAGPDVIEINKQVIQEHFSPSRYADTLHAIYTTLIDSAARENPVDYLPPQQVLDQFLEPFRFNLLRS